jgi:hypothetical protein
VPCLNPALARDDERLAKQGLTVVAETPERFADDTANGMAEWQKVVRDAKLSAE